MENQNMFDLDVTVQHSETPESKIIAIMSIEVCF
ncbi:hypothetical protein EV586_11132 [Tumebacillus sp. BK434]|nr:hypothetical protein EV586_11132 [Tumebacillus sp. BK434]